jgi:hypothetical protein
MIFLSEKENLIVLHPKSGEILVRFKNGKCFIDEDKKDEIELMKNLGYKFEEEVKENLSEIIHQEAKIQQELINKVKRQKNNIAKEVI